MERIYIAPDKNGIIAGIKVKALSLQKRNVSKFDNVCAKCEIKSLNICFEHKVKGKNMIQASLDTRPACFGNDPENTKKCSVYYVKA